jgi:hypothetical protein
MVFKYILDKSQHFKYLSNGFRRLAIAIGFIVSFSAVSAFIETPRFYNLKEIIFGFSFFVVGGIPLTLFIFNIIAWIIDGFKKDWAGKHGPKDG